MQKKHFIGLAAALLFLSMVGTANATLIGDTVTAQHYFPDISSPLSNLAQTIVAAGTSDLMYPHSGTWYNVNVEADSIYVDFVGSATWTTTSFNGLVVDSLNDSTGNALQGVSITTNLLGWDISRLTFDQDTANFNWNGLSFTADSYFLAELDFGDSGNAPVPEPATMLLLGTGLTGLVGTRIRRRKNA